MLMFIGNINISVEKFSVIWWVVIMVVLNGVSKRVMIENSVILNNMVIVMGKFILKVWWIMVRLGWYSVLNKWYIFNVGVNCM